MFCEKSVLPPPWIRYPQIDRGSIEWRMGVGEAYVNRWNAFRRSLSPQELCEYYRLFPEPAVWRGAMTGDKPLSKFCSGGLCLEQWRENDQPRYSREQLKEDGVILCDKNVVFFWGHRPSEDGRIKASCMSQWFMSPFYVYATKYCCMEQFMMASKACLFNDKETFDRILQSSDPKEIKALGRQVKNFDKETWDKAKYLVVLNGNYRKFTQNPALRDYLLSTGNHFLVEASPYDCIWGIGLSADDPHALEPSQWKGENLLGSALMEVRDDIQRTYQNLHLCREQPEIF